MKIAVLKAPALWLLVLAVLVTTIGFWLFSISSYDKASDAFPWLLLVSELLILFGGIGTLISLVALLGTMLLRWNSGNKGTSL